jgi:hypothetical protein
VPVPNTTAVHKYIRRPLTMGSIPNSMRTSERHMLKKKFEIGARVETSPRNR